MKPKNKIHSTNYYDTFIEVAEDCKVAAAKIPEQKNGKKTIAFMQFDRIAQNPYQFTSDDVLFQIFAEKSGSSEKEMDEAKKLFFSKGQACFRASPLAKQFGWGIHCDAAGKMAVYGMETEKYRQFLENESIKKIKAMRNSRK